MDISKVRSESWNDPRLEVRVSPIHGQGIFATADIRAGEVLMIWGGTFFTEEEALSGKALKLSWTTIEEGLVLGHTPEHGNSVDDFINHSCDPNVWMQDEVTLTAMRDIRAGEEIVADLVFWWEPDNPYIAWDCSCGSSGCRKTFTSEDWRRPELQERYRGHFLPYINRMIEALREEDTVRSDRYR